jgi:hypothetical protein
MFCFFRRRKKADATPRRIIDQGLFLGARTREAVEMSWDRLLSENKWFRHASLKERPIEWDLVGGSKQGSRKAKPLGSPARTWSFVGIAAPPRSAVPALIALVRGTLRFLRLLGSSHRLLG